MVGHADVATAVLSTRYVEVVERESDPLCRRYPDNPVTKTRSGVVTRIVGTGQAARRRRQLSSTL